MAHKDLSKAKSGKNDEFYTQYIDIQKEVSAYLEYNPDVFRDKVVYCNADDPYESNFFKYFVLNFNRFGLKQLITTSYKPSPVAKFIYVEEIKYGRRIEQAKTWKGLSVSASSLVVPSLIWRPSSVTNQAHRDLRYHGLWTCEHASCFWGTT